MIERETHKHTVSRSVKSAAMSKKVMILKGIIIYFLINDLTLLIESLDLSAEFLRQISNRQRLIRGTLWALNSVHLK